ncbi:MAG: phosphoenolpyruvate--protein phosphotransferase [Chloroflexi bacterium]|nr:phosphoenolpyruvate--protein phosphotransferase [Chloroflexota bacterium]
MRLMFPMIATLDEFRRAKNLVEQAGEELSSSGTDMMVRFQIGIMVEIPSVSILADRFASEVDFFSIGTNDLTQYTMAAERGNKRLAHLNDPCHPAILRQIDQVVRAAHARGKWVGICGEMGGDPEAVPILLGLGIDELSMSPARIPRVKRIIRKWSMADARQVATRALEQENAEDIRRLVNSSPPI